MTRIITTLLPGIRQAKSLVIVLACTLLGSLSNAQTATDSIEARLKEAGNDSTRFILLLRLSKEAEFTDYSKCRTYADEAAIIANRINAKWAFGKLYFRLAFMASMEGDYAKALQYDRTCAELYVGGDSTSLANAYIDVGADHRDLGDYNEAYYYLTQSFWIARNHGTIPNKKDSLTMAIALHNIGTVFAEIGQYDIAYQHMIISQKISEAIGDLEGPAYSKDEIGDLYRRRGDFDKAQENLLASRADAQSLKIRFLVPRILSHLANLYLDKGDFPLALQYFDSVKSFHTGIRNRFGLAECDLGTGKLMTRTGNYPAALKLYESSLAASTKLNARNLTLSCYSEMSSLFEKMKDYEKAISFLRKYEVLRDSIFSSATMEKLLQSQVLFETRSRDDEILALSRARLQQTSEIQRQELIQNILVVVAVLAIILLYTVYRSGRRRKRINRMLLEHQEEIKRRSVELQQLNQVKDKFFSIISHDLRSPMNALSAILNLLDQRNITAEEFSGLTQNLRVQFNHTQTLINNLLDWALLQMDKLRIQQENVILSKSVDESFDALRGLYPKQIHMENRVSAGLIGFADPNILNLVLRNLILNAIKFTESGGNIWVDAWMEGGDIVVSVADDGIGIQPEIKKVLFEKTRSYSTRGTANEKGTGLGLILCKEFVERNGGSIWMQSEPGRGSTFFFSLPGHRVTEPSLVVT